MIGFYNYTVWLTYLSLMTSVYGIFCSFNGRVGAAVVCLGLSGFFDAFDGAVARTKKDRTKLEKAFGIQIDSLSDIVCFGVGPAAAAYAMGMKNAIGIAVLLLYCTAGLIRLAYFNVTEEERQKETSGKRRFYQGLPITASSVIVPLFYLLSLLIRYPVLPAVYFVMGATGLCFVLDVKVPKPGIREILILTGIVAAVALAALLFA